mgnify:CR=1 FL=1
MIVEREEEVGKKKRAAKGKEEMGKQGAAPSQGRGADFTWAVVYLIAAVLIMSHCAHWFLSIEYAPAIVGLSLFLALVAWISGGGMVDFAKFDQRNAILGMAVAVLFLLATASIWHGRRERSIDRLAALVKDEQSKSSPEVSDTEDWKPSMDDVLEPKETKPPINPSKGGGQQAMGLINALKNAPPKVPEGPPTKEEWADASESARRFFWALINGQDSFIEAECTVDFAKKAQGLGLPDDWIDQAGETLAYESVELKDQQYDGEKMHFIVAAGEREGKIQMSKDIGWEVSSFEAKGPGN